MQCNKDSTGSDKVLVRLPLEYETLRETLNNNYVKTCYQLAYSLNEFTSTNERTRLSKSKLNITHFAHYPTCYKTYYTNIQSIPGVYEIAKPSSVYDKHQIKREFNTILDAGKSTYYADICNPAMELRKRLNSDVLLNSYIDRYMERGV